MIDLDPEAQLAKIHESIDRMISQILRIAEYDPEHRPAAERTLKALNLSIEMARTFAMAIRHDQPSQKINDLF